MSSRRTRLLAATAAAALLGLTACSGPAAGGGATDGSSHAGSVAPIAVVTSFYPLEYLVARIGGDRVDVNDLTQPGAEPHDLELTPKDVAAVAGADQVFYLKGFQAAVDDAVSNEAADHSFDVTPAAGLTLTFTPIEQGEAVAGQAGATDPHFWLDPTRYAAVAQAIASQLSTLSPADAPTFAANAATLTAELETLDADWMTATADCTNDNLVTSHNAFGYLAQRYHLVQTGITGLTPEAEPSPKQLAAVSDLVIRNNVKTIYFESLVSPAIARAVASETGAQTAVLDPIEGLSDTSAGSDYFEIMRSNLANVVAGQPCG